MTTKQKKRRRAKSVLDEQGVLERTETLRQSERRVQCGVPGDQRCHDTGLNLMKEILNYYTTVRSITLDDEELSVLKHDINDPHINIRCCSFADNVRDKYTEKEVLRYIFHREPTRASDMSPVARHMFAQLVAFLETVRSHTRIDGHVALILDDIRGEKFPLQRYCFACQSLCLPSDAIGSSSNRFAFCQVLCRIAYTECYGPLTL